MGVMANMLEISIFPPNSQWNLNLRAVVDGLTINWGRTNLYRAPANRTCQFQMLMEHVTLTRVMQKWVNSEIIITAKPASGNLVIFQGIIDDFKVTPRTRKSVITLLILPPLNRLPGQISSMGFFMMLRTFVILILV